MDDAEALSRLLADDLPPHQADALRARLLQEPELAALWAALAALPDALAALPDSEPPPLRSEAPGRPTPRSRWWPWSIAAAAALAALWPRALPETVLLDGSALVRGHTALHAGDVPVTVDGLARIAVEPRPRVARGGGQEDPMNATHLMAAAIGAAVTVTVYEGSAHLGGTPDVPATTLRAGEARTVRRAPPDLSEPPPGIPPSAPREEDDVAALSAEVDRLTSELQTLRFTHGLTQGRLSAVEGEPQPWTAAHPDAFRPEAFAALLDALVAESDGLSVRQLDCDEFPCVALLAIDPDIDDPRAALAGLEPGLRAAAGGPLAVSEMVAEADAGDGPPIRLVALAAHPPADSPGLPERTGFRARALLDDAMQAIPPGEAGSDDVEIRR